MSLEIKITRSFSAKVNLGNYENVDVSCSAQAVVPEEQMDAYSEYLFNFCREQVRDDANAIKSSKRGLNA